MKAQQPPHCPWFLILDTALPLQSMLLVVEPVEVNFFFSLVLSGSADETPVPAYKGGRRPILYSSYF